jgi:hypothetical protein
MLGYFIVYTLLHYFFFEVTTTYSLEFKLKNLRVYIGLAIFLARRDALIVCDQDVTVAVLQINMYFCLKSRYVIGENPAGWAGLDTDRVV